VALYAETRQLVLGRGELAADLGVAQIAKVVVCIAVRRQLVAVGAHAGNIIGIVAHPGAGQEKRRVGTPDTATRGEKKTAFDTLAVP